MISRHSGSSTLRNCSVNSLVILIFTETSQFLRGLCSIHRDILQCHTSDHYLATLVPPGGRSSTMFPCQVVIVLVLWGVCPLRSPGSLSLIVCSVHHRAMTFQRLFIQPNHTVSQLMTHIMFYARYGHNLLWLLSLSSLS